MLTIRVANVTWCHLLYCFQTNYFNLRNATFYLLPSYPHVIPNQIPTETMVHTGHNTIIFYKYYIIIPALRHISKKYGWKYSSFY